MPGKEACLGRKREQNRADTLFERCRIRSVEIGSSGGFEEKRISTENNLARFAVKADTSRGMSRRMEDAKIGLAHRSPVLKGRFDRWYTFDHRPERFHTVVSERFENLPCRRRIVSLEQIAVIGMKQYRDSRFVQPVSSDDFRACRQVVEMTVCKYDQPWRYIEYLEARDNVVSFRSRIDENALLLRYRHYVCVSVKWTDDDTFNHNLSVA